MAKIISRAGWGARSPRDPYTALRSARGVKVHYVGSHVDVRIVDDHRICLQLMMQIQRQHMNGNGWSDFAYNMAGCPHGRMIMGRGPRVMSAANGAGRNSDHYAVLALLGSSGYAVPTPGLLTAVRDCIDYLRKNGAGDEIKGHRDGYGTQCPGDRLYAWVRAGAPRPTEEDDDVSAHDVLHGPHIKMNKGTKDEKDVSLAYFVQHLETEQDETQQRLVQLDGRLRGIEAKLDAVLAKLGA